MAEYPAMPLWTDAYLGDTLHLSLEEHGAYLKMLMIAWRSPGHCLPDDDRRIATMLGVSVSRWRKKIRPAMEPFWTIADGGWRQKRLEKVHDFVSKRSTKQREKANARWKRNPLKDNKTDDAAADAAGMPDAMHPNPNPKDSESVREIESNGDASHEASFDLDTLFYRRGKAVLGPKAGGQLTKLKDACGGPGQALDIIAQAERKENPAEYIAGVLRARKAKQADPFLI